MHGHLIPQEKRRGRGATHNHTSRYDSQTRHSGDDGWGLLDRDESRLKTRVALDRSRSVIATNRSPDVPFTQSINPYRGCEHGCTYCFARPSHAQLGLSPGLDFETELTAKPDAPDLLRKALARPGYQVDPIAIGTNTDPYQPIERDWKIMRGLLEVFEETGHPVTITTKSHMITRDLDILQRLAARRLVHVSISVTTLDHRLSRAMEPRASTPTRRLDAIYQLHNAGVPASVLVAPVVPGLTDHEMEAILAAARKAGATGASWLLLRLPGEVKDIFADWLAEAFPTKANKVLRLIRSMRQGRLNDPRFRHRMRGEGPIAAMLSQRFRLACERHGLGRASPDLACDQFKPPTGDNNQLSLFA